MIDRSMLARAASMLAASISIPTLAACSASNGSGDLFTTSSGSGASGGGGSTATSGGTSAQGGGGSSGIGIYDGGFVDGGSGGGCLQETQFIYTITADNNLYRFDPPTLDFTLVGAVNCPSAFSPYSMAVDRQGKAWVVFEDGSIFNVDTTNAACTATSFVPGQHGWTTFGMGFSSNAPNSEDETLFVSDSGGFGGTTMGLASIDVQTLTLNPVGAYDLISARAEMTGTGDARLFGAFEGSPYVVAEIQKSDAHILSQAPQTAINYAPGSSNFAFAFWGGDFWLFVGPGFQTDVFHYVPSTGVTTNVKTVTFEIVGAGVSTCAPTAPPT